MYWTTVCSVFDWRRPSGSERQLMAKASVAPEPARRGLSPTRAASSVARSAGMNGLVTGTIRPLARLLPPATTSEEVANRPLGAVPGA